MLITSFLVLVFVLSLGAIFFMRSVSEKRMVEVEKFTMQADFLAEAGANHALSELRERIRQDLTARISQVRNGALINAYFVNQDSLGLLRDYAYAQGDDQFTVANGQAVLALSSLDLITGIQGAYNAEVILTQAASPTNPSLDTYEFYYNFVARGTGIASALSPNISKQVTLLGSFVATIRRDNFAKYALFTEHHRAPSGTTVWFTENTNFFGPVFTNERFSFAHNPGPHFTDEVGQHLDSARFYNNGWPALINDDHNGVIDVPLFDQGFARGEPLTNLQSSVNLNDLITQSLGTMQEPGQSGIYVPNEGGAVTGGVYIRGDVSTMVTGVDADSNAFYTVTQGSTTKTITVDYANQTTKVETQGGPTENYSGIPDGVDNEGVLIFARGDINSLSGTIQKDSVVTISSQRDIVISNHLRYQDYNSAAPINALGYTNMLGVFSVDGDVRIGTSAPDDIEIHGIVLAPHGIFTVDNYSSRPAQGTATLLGGVISDFYGPFGTFWGQTQLSGYGRNFVYDQRVLAGLTPPYFPYMANYIALDDGALDKRPLWKKD